MKPARGHLPEPIMRRTIKEISVEGFLRKKPGNRMAYSIRVTWSDKSANVIYRRYSEVKQLELSLLKDFPSYKKELISSSLQERRRITPTSVRTKENKIKNFISTLMALPEQISQSQLVMKLFTPRIEDLEWQESNHTKDLKKSKSKSTRKISVGRNTSKTAFNIGEPVLLEQYVALKDYKKQYHNDISLTYGFTVDVIEKHESGWWLVDCEGDIGWVPASFMQPTGGETNNDDDDIITDSFLPGRGELHMTTKSYEAKNEDEISFEIGVHLEVIEKTLDGWWRVIYMDKEGLAPAVYLKRLSFTAGAAQQGLRRRSGMSMRLRENTSDIDGIRTNGLVDGGSTLLLPVWNGSRRHSSSEVELSSSAEKFRLSRNRRSSYHDMREALPNRGFFISGQDLRIADREERGSYKKQSRSFSLKSGAKKEKIEGQFPKHLTSLMVKELPGKHYRTSSTSEVDLRKADTQDGKYLLSKELQRSHSFSIFSGNIKGVSGKRNLRESVSAETSKTKVEITNDSSLFELPRRRHLLSPTARRRSSLSPSPKLQNEFEEDSMQFPLPTICITPSQSDTEDDPVTLCIQGDEKYKVSVDSFNENSVILDDNQNEGEKGNKTPEEELRNEQLLELEANVIEEACDNIEEDNKQYSTEEQEEVGQRSDINEAKVDENFEGICGTEDHNRKIDVAELGKGKKEGEVAGKDKSKTREEEDVETQLHVEMVLVMEAENSGSKSSFLHNRTSYYSVSPYEARGTGEITLYEGDEVKVEKKAGNGWWLVRINEVVGWAPSNFLAVADKYQMEDSTANKGSGINQGSRRLEYDGCECESSDGSENDDAECGGDDVVANDDKNHNGKYDDDDDDEYDKYTDDSYESDDNNDDDDDVLDKRSSDVRRLSAWKQRQFSAVQKRGRLVGSYQETHTPKWAPSNNCWFESNSYRGRNVIRSSSGTESSSANSTTRPMKRDGREYRGFIDNSLRYKEGRGNHGRRGFDSLRCKDADFTPCKEKDYSTSKTQGEKKTVQKSPLLKQRKVASYDSGYPEDERRKGLKKIKQSFSHSSAMVGQTMQHPALCRKCRTLPTDGYAVGSYFKPGFNTSESSDEEVFQVTSKRESCCGDFEVVSYNRREGRDTRKKINGHQNHYKTKATSNNSGHPTRGRRRRSTYQAIAMYQAMSEKEIDLYEGDKVQVIRKSRGGWWYVNIDHEEGWAPSNFLKSIPWFNK